MSYSDFTLKKAKSELKLQLVENQSLFETVKEVTISDYLAQTLKRNVPLALAINTEKARSELIIINVLLEIKEQLEPKISLFSGIDFNVKKEQGLTGFCDYIISNSPEQLFLEKPVIIIVEAKNENIIGGLGQCIAEMYAAQLYNKQDNYDLPYIYGAVTTGSEWRFIKLQKNIVYIDTDIYSVNQIGLIVAILRQSIQMTNEVTKDGLQ
ncbi:MAG: hypothetical protein AB4058_19065 [Microcystaceae cyanobacterium]